VLLRNDPEGFRYFLLAVHYRGPIQFDTEQRDGRVVFPGVDEAERRMDYLYATVGRLNELLGSAPTASATLLPELEQKRQGIQSALERADAAMDDDLNTVVALASLGEIATLGNEISDLAAKRRKNEAALSSSIAAARVALSAIGELCGQLGLMQASAEEYTQRTQERRLRLREISSSDIGAKVEARNAARRNKDFALADAIRAELAQSSITLRDSPDGTVWTIEQ
jgi:cysteinyl-tRNA synthetase